MANLTDSDKYGIAAAIGLLILVLVNNPLVMLVVSAAGIIAGFWVVRRGEVRRVVFVAFIAFVIAALFAIISLVRPG